MQDRSNINFVYQLFMAVSFYMCYMSFKFLKIYFSMVILTIDLHSRLAEHGGCERRCVQLGRCL